MDTLRGEPGDRAELAALLGTLRDHGDRMEAMVGRLEAQVLRLERMRDGGGGVTDGPGGSAAR